MLYGKWPFGVDVQIGFLYLRYVADLKILWTWYEPYLRDDEVHDSFSYFQFFCSSSELFYHYTCSMIL
jgi:hypothetical protein